MCTALTLKTKDGYSLFGRNMDLSYSFNQAVTLLPRNYEYRDRVTGNMKKTKFAIIGMASVIDDYPAFADAMNEKGLGCAGLNFPGYCYLEKDKVEGKNNLAPYDFIIWVLSNFETVDEVLKEVLKDKIFYEDNGGVTFSGGEALLYAKELLPLMEQIKQNNISIAVESSLSNHQVILRW